MTQAVADRGQTGCGMAGETTSVIIGFLYLNIHMPYIFTNKIAKNIHTIFCDSGLEKDAQPPARPARGEADFFRSPGSTLPRKTARRAAGDTHGERLQSKACVAPFILETGQKQNQLKPLNSFRVGLSETESKLYER